MTTLALPLLLLAFLAASAFGGPWLVRRAAPALVRTPLLAVGLLGASLAGWVVGLLALGPLLAWLTAGPTILPVAAGEICQRCVAAASPFTGTGAIEAAIPDALLLGLPALALAALLAAAGRRARSHARQARQTWRSVTLAGRRLRVDGHDITVVPDPRPLAFTLPRRRCGTVVSDGLLRLLDDDELAAVLAHEETHLRQRHHLITTLVSALAHPLRSVPLVTAIADAVPHYLEIAADDTARRRASTPALASALLKIGDAHVGPAGAPVAAGALHAAGPDRIRHLVNPGTTPGASSSALALGLQLATLVALAVAVHGPYLYAVVTGCLT